MKRTIKHFIRYCVVPCALAMFGAVSLSQEQADGQAGVDFGLGAELRYDDNIFRSRTEETDSLILEAVPFVRGSLYNKGNVYQITYRLNHAEYFDSSEDNYDDHVLEIDLNQRFTERQAIALELGYENLTEQRGTGFSELPTDLADGPDDYVHQKYGLKYFLGQPAADLRFELSAKRDVLDFDSSYVGDTRDYESDVLGALARYRLGSKTEALLEYRKQFVRYDNTPLDVNDQPLDLDSDEDYFLAGLAWELTAKTRGEVKIGHSARDYGESDFSTSDFHWEATLEWLPKSYSKFALNTARESLETYGTGLFINTRRYELKWDHAWSGRFSSEIKGGLIADNYEEGNRDDDQAFWQVQFDYDYANWVDFSLGYRFWENESNFELVEYTQNIFYLKAAIEL